MSYDKDLESLSASYRNNPPKRIVKFRCMTANGQKVRIGNTLFCWPVRTDRIKRESLGHSTKELIDMFGASEIIPTLKESLKDKIKIMNNLEYRWEKYKDEAIKRLKLKFKKLSKDKIKFNVWFVIYIVAIKYPHIGPIAIAKIKKQVVNLKRAIYVSERINNPQVEDRGKSKYIDFNETNTTSIVQVVGSYSVSLKKKGRQYWGCCPIHKENTPSFSIDENKNVFFCHGCKAYGKPINFVMAMENCSAVEAAKMINENF